MFNFFSQHKKLFSNICLILLLSFLGVFIFQVQGARAFWGELTFDIIAKIISYLGAIFRTIASLFFWIASMLLDLSFGLETFTKAGIVQTGWQLTRDLVNMFFVLVLLVIAFGLILRQETYGSKAILGHLIIVALLINFSLVICGVIIDSSQVVTHFFYDEINAKATGFGAGGQGGISAHLGDSFNLQKTVQLPDGADAKQFAAGIGGSINMIFSIIFGTLLIIAATIAVALGAFFMIVRLIYLWILMIFVPLAWFAWILPGTAHYAKDWWNKFLGWVFFAPTYSFFLWLAIKASQGGTFENIIQQGVNDSVTASGWATIGFAFTPAILIQFLCVTGLLYGGLMAASKIGAYGAKGAMSLVDGGKKWVEGGVKSMADRTKSRAESAAGKVGEKMAESKWGVLRQMARPFRAAQEAGRATDKTVVGEYEKKYKNYTDDNLIRELPSIVATPHARAAIAKLLAERGKLTPDKDWDEPKKKKFNGNILEALKAAKKFDTHKEILKARPDLYNTVGEDLDKLIGSIKPKDMENLQAFALSSQNPNQDAVNKVRAAILKQLTTKEGKWDKNSLAKLDENNHAAFEIIQEEIIKEEIMPQKKWEKIEKDGYRQDILSYITSDPGKILFHEIKGALAWRETPLPSSATATGTASGATSGTTGTGSGRTATGASTSGTTTGKTSGGKKKKRRKP